MSRRVALLLCCAVAALGLSCGREGGTTAEPTAPAEPTKLRVVVLPFLDFAPLYIAKDKGYYEDQNLEVEFVPMTNSQEALPALAQGRLDVVGGSISAGLFNAIGRGSDIKIVADKSYFGPETPSNCVRNAIVATPALIDSGDIKGAADLKGRKVRSNNVNVEAYALHVYLKSAGLSLDDVELVDIPPPNVFDAMGKGGLDVTLASEPTLTRLIDAGKAKILAKVDDDIVPGLQVGMMMYGPNLLTKDKDAGRRFMVAYLKGVKAYREGKTQANIASIAKATKLEAGLVGKVCWPAFRADGRIDWDSVDEMQKWALDGKLIDETVTEAEFWTDEFVDDAEEDV
jgi:NitT/TauT family transport system substrate-binding protein